MRKIAAFVRLSRLTFLFGGFAGFGLGAAVAAAGGAPISAGAYAAGQLMVTGFHLMTHYANEFFDRAADRHGTPTAFSGGSGVIATGELRARTALTAALLCAGAGLLSALWFTASGAPLTAALGVAIGAGAWAYSAPPVRLAARGWGELDTTLVVGVLVPSAGYAAFTGRVDGAMLGATVAPAAAMFAMMIAVEWPDRAADAAAGKRNLVVRLGSPGAAYLATGGALVALAALLLAVGRCASWAGAPFALLLLPVAVGFVRALTPPARPAVEIAARGVTLFALTVSYELLGYVTFLR
jgi:1,4-dihydroxy-2-naphthoate octaprenyltransferase